MPTSPYLKIDRIEFVVTLACTGRCRHCSVAPRLNTGAPARLAPDIAAGAVTALATRFGIGSVMTFGGEPLLQPETTCAVHSAAREAGIPSRQLITNGFFSKSPAAIDETAAGLVAAGVNGILLSVDAFHQETIPLDMVRLFAEAVARRDKSILRLHPAWVVGPEDDNPYNAKTRRVLAALADLGLEASKGNVVFPAGNAAVYLREYYPAPAAAPDLTAPCGSARYTTRLDEVRTLSIGPDGVVQACCFPIGSVHGGIDAIAEGYDPYRSEATAALLRGGVPALAEYARRRGVEADAAGHPSACSVCRQLAARLY